MKFKDLKKYAKLGYVVLSFLILMTMFLPFVSIDRYTEYEFSGGYYNESYTSFTTPKATKIKPVTIIQSLFAKRNKLHRFKAEYNEAKNELTAKLESGEISADEFEQELASHPATSKYTFLSIKFADDKELSRLQGKTFLYAVILLLFYVVCAISLVANLLNLFLKKSFLSILNVFTSWIMTLLLLLFNLYTFTLAVSFDNQITGFSGKIMEKVTTCMSPKTLPLLLMFLLVALSVFATILDKKESREIVQNKEIPIAVSANISGGNRFRKINSKKNKYKHGSKKKRRR